MIIQTPSKLARLALCLLFTATQTALSGAAFADSNAQAYTETLSFSDGIANIPTSDNESHLVHGTVMYGPIIGIDAANRLAKDGVFIGKDTKKNYIDLVYGNVLFIPDKDMTVSTRVGNISMNAGTIVFIRESENGLTLYDLTQASKKEVALTIKKYKLVMQPGRMLILTRENIKDIDQSDNNFGTILCYNMRSLDLGNTAVKAYVADFSLPSALFAIEPLRRLATSNNPQDRLAIESLMKNTQMAKDIATKDNTDTQIKQNPRQNSSTRSQRMSVQ